MRAVRVSGSWQTKSPTTWQLNAKTDPRGWEGGASRSKWWLWIRIRHLSFFFFCPIPTPHYTSCILCFLPFVWGIILYVSHSLSHHLSHLDSFFFHAYCLSLHLFLFPFCSAVTTPCHSFSFCLNPPLPPLLIHIIFYLMFKIKSLNLNFRA